MEQFGLSTGMVWAGGRGGEYLKSERELGKLEGWTVSPDDTVLNYTTYYLTEHIHVHFMV